MMRPGYKQTEVGILPEDWRVVKLHEVMHSFQNGYAFSAKGYASVGIPIVTMAQIGLDGSFQFHEDRVNYWPTSFLDELKPYHLKDGDLIISMTDVTPDKNLIGRMAIVRSKQLTLLNQRVGLLRLNHNEIDPLFLAVYSHQYYWRQYSKSVASLGVQANISTRDIKNGLIGIPSIGEQRAITAALSDVDGLLVGLDRLIAKKRAVKTAVMQQLLTGEVRVGEGNGRWETATIEELEKAGLVRLSRGKVISKQDIDRLPGDFPIYSSSVKNDGVFGRYGEFMFDEEMITWSVDGGGHFFYRSKHRFSVTNVCGYMRLDSSKLDYKFLAAQLQLLHSRLNFDYQTKAHPSVIRKAYTVSIPGLGEQNAIAAILSDIDAEIAALEARRAKTAAIKQGMMQELLTGRTRLVDN